MFWINLLMVLTPLTTVVAASDNDVAAPSSAKLDSTLRNALLKALTELESEQESTSDVEKAQATSFTVLAKDEPESRNVTAAAAPTLIFQKSDSLPATSVTSLEREDLDPVKDAEQIITSATDGFAAKLTDTPINHNSITDDDEEDDVVKPETTTTTTTTTTEENEAKVEQVQLFSAPLVAAFTVHQDERGEPDRVEPIFTTAKPKDVETKELRDKELALEEEIRRLRSQQLRFKQQLLQREQLRFEPVFTEPTRTVVGRFAAEEQKVGAQGVALDMFTASEAKPNTDNSTAVSVRPGPSFDQLIEAGKLPANAQLLPIKDAVNFHSPFAKDPAYKQFAFQQNVADQGARVIQAQLLPGANFFNPLQPQLPTQQPPPQQSPFQPTPQSQSPESSSLQFHGARQSPQAAFQPAQSPQQSQLAIHSPQLTQTSPQKYQLDLRLGQSVQRPQQAQLAFQSAQQAQLSPQLAFQSARPPQQAQLSPQLAFQSAQPPQQAQLSNQLAFQSARPPQQDQLSPQLAFQSALPPQQAQLSPQLAFQPVRPPQQTQLPFQSVQQTQLSPQLTFQQFQSPLGLGQPLRQTQQSHQQSFSTNNNYNNNFLGGQQQNRFHRQESDTGNFLNSPGFSIQQSTQPFPARHEIGFFATDLSRYNQDPGHPHQQNTRFFRSNFESRAPPGGYFPQRVNHQLSNLLVNSGFGSRSNEDLNIVAKVLSLNHGRSDVYRNVPLVK